MQEPVGRPVHKGDTRLAVGRDSLNLGTCMGNRFKGSFGTADHRSFCMKSIQRTNKYVAYGERRGQGEVIGTGRRAGQLHLALRWKILWQESGHINSSRWV